MSRRINHASSFSLLPSFSIKCFWLWLQKTWFSAKQSLCLALMSRSKLCRLRRYRTVWERAVHALGEWGRNAGREERKCFQVREFKREVVFLASHCGQLHHMASRWGPEIWCLRRRSAQRLPLHVAVCMYCIMFSSGVKHSNNKLTQQIMNCTFWMLLMQ